MGKKAAGVTTPISSRELELICKARHIAGKLEGLREAAEMLCKRAEIKREQADRAFEADDEADQHGYSHAAFCLQQEADAILTRIAELENPRHE